MIRFHRRQCWGLIMQQGDRWKCRRHCLERGKDLFFMLLIKLSLVLVPVCSPLAFNPLYPLIFSFFFFFLYCFYYIIFLLFSYVLLNF